MDSRVLSTSSKRCTVNRKRSRRGRAGGGQCGRGTAVWKGRTGGEVGDPSRKIERLRGGREQPALGDDGGDAHAVHGREAFFGDGGDPEEEQDEGPSERRRAGLSAAKASSRLDGSRPAERAATADVSEGDVRGVEPFRAGSRVQASTFPSRRSWPGTSRPPARVRPPASSRPRSAQPPPPTHGGSSRPRPQRRRAPDPEKAQHQRPARDVADVRQQREEGPADDQQIEEAPRAQEPRELPLRGGKLDDEIEREDGDERPFQHLEDTAGRGAEVEDERAEAAASPTRARNPMTGSSRTAAMRAAAEGRSSICVSTLRVGILRASR